MLNLIITILVLGVILLIEEIAWRKSNLAGEYLRKFIHISNGTILAFSPWWLSWTQIRLLVILTFLISVLNIRVGVFSHLSKLRRGYGDVYFALGVLFSSTLTSNKTLFCVAVLNMALADGLAAVAGQIYGKGWQYKIFGQTKTVIGTMVFWLVSLSVLGIGLALGSSLISFSGYILSLIVLPPILVALENVSVFGLDNFVIPVSALLFLRFVS